MAEQEDQQPSLPAAPDDTSTPSTCHALRPVSSATWCDWRRRDGSMPPRNVMQRPRSSPDVWIDRGSDDDHDDPEAACQGGAQDWRAAWERWQQEHEEHGGGGDMNSGQDVILAEVESSSNSPEEDEADRSPDGQANDGDDPAKAISTANNADEEEGAIGDAVEDETAIEVVDEEENVTHDDDISEAVTEEITTEDVIIGHVFAGEHIAEETIEQDPSVKESIEGHTVEDDTTIETTTADIVVQGGSSIDAIIESAISVGDSSEAINQSINEGIEENVKDCDVEEKGIKEDGEDGKDDNETNLEGKHQDSSAWNGDNVPIHDVDVSVSGSDVDGSNDGDSDNQAANGRKYSTDTGSIPHHSSPRREPLWRTGSIRRTFGRAIPQLPRHQTLKRQQSERRNNLSPVQQTLAERRALSADRRSVVQQPLQQQRQERPHLAFRSSAPDMSAAYHRTDDAYDRSLLSNGSTRPGLDLDYDGGSLAAQQDHHHHHHHQQQQTENDPWLGPLTPRWRQSPLDLWDKNTSGGRVLEDGRLLVTSPSLASQDHDAPTGPVQYGDDGAQNYHYDEADYNDEADAADPHNFLQVRDDGVEFTDRLSAISGEDAHDQANDDSVSVTSSQWAGVIAEELEKKWILNLSMHFRDKSKREKFFVTYRERTDAWRRVTVSLDYRDAADASLEGELARTTYQRDKSAKIYEAIRDSLADIKFYDTVTNLKLQTTDGRLHVHVMEDSNVSFFRVCERSCII